MAAYISEHRQCPDCKGGKTKRLDFAFRGYEVTEDRVCRNCETKFRTVFELEEKEVRHD